MFGDRFSSSTSCSRWLHETEPGRLDQSLSCRFLKVATHPHESRMVFWLSRTWNFLLALMCAGFMGATAYHLSRTFTGWVERTISSWWAG